MNNINYEEIKDKLLGHYFPVKGVKPINLRIHKIEDYENKLLLHIVKPGQIPIFYKCYMLVQIGGDSLLTPIISPLASETPKPSNDFNSEQFLNIRGEIKDRINS